MNTPYSRYDRTAVYMLAEQVSRASRLADGPISYYHAKADVIEWLNRGYTLGQLPGIYREHYGAETWTAAARVTP